MVDDQAPVKVGPGASVGLAKICRKLGVKKPPRGFWAKVANGTRMKKPPLGALPDSGHLFKGCVATL
jgi:hypothetical protein